MFHRPEIGGERKYAPAVCKYLIFKYLIDNQINVLHTGKVTVIIQNIISTCTNEIFRKKAVRNNKVGLRA